MPSERSNSREVNLADQFMPPSARVGDQEARRLGLMKEEPSRAVTLASLSTEPPAGPTVMQRAHENGLRRVARMLKNHFLDPAKAEDDIRGALVLYLREWEKIYKQGVSESPSTVDRTILDIRRDTVAQILREIGRPPAQAQPVPGSAHGSGDTGDRPPDGLPPGDF